MTTIETRRVRRPPATSVRPRPRTSRRVARLLPAAAVVVLAVAGPWLVRSDPTLIVGAPSQSPGGRFWFGTDSSGFDVYSRVVDAFRTNVVIAALVTALATFVGIVAGLAMGMNESRRGPRGWAARGVARGLDLLQAVPTVIIGLVAVAMFRPSQVTLVVVISLLLLAPQVRLVRTEALRVRAEGFVDAARMAGLSELRLTARHVLPNSIRPALQNGPVIFGATVVLTAALGFLGVGLPPPTPEWGAMISTGAPDVAIGRWWTATFPALALVLTVTSVALAGEALFGRRSRAGRDR